MYDVFISYARADNRQGRSKWVEALHELLAPKISSLLRRDANIWIDWKIEDGTDVPPELVSAVSDSRLLLVILSPRYLGSPWCELELTPRRAEISRGKDHQQEAAVADRRDQLGRHIGAVLDLPVDPDIRVASEERADFRSEQLVQRLDPLRSSLPVVCTGVADEDVVHVAPLPGNANAAAACSGAARRLD